MSIIRTATYAVLPSCFLSIRCTEYNSLTIPYAVSTYKRNDNIPNLIIEKTYTNFKKRRNQYN